MKIKEVLLQYAAELKHGLNEQHGTPEDQALKSIEQIILDEVIGEAEDTNSLADTQDRPLFLEANAMARNDLKTKQRKALSKILKEKS